MTQTSGIVVRLERDIVIRFEHDLPHVASNLSHKIIQQLEAWLKMWMWDKANKIPPPRCLACEYEFRDSNPPPAFVLIYFENCNEFGIQGPICASCAQKNDSDLLAIGIKDAIKRMEEYARAQTQEENFARLAHEVKRAVEALEDAFTGLADWPDSIGEMMPQLADVAHDVADNAKEWARGGNANFDPSRPKANRTAISEPRHKAIAALQKALKKEPRGFQ
jgi:hypothetical protein